MTRSTWYSRHHSGNPIYHAALAFNETWLFPLWPCIGTCLLLFCLYLASYKLFKIRVAVFIGVSYMLHAALFSWARQAHNNDIYEYNGYGLFIVLCDFVCLICGVGTWYETYERCTFAARLGLNVDDVRIEQAFSMITGEGRDDITTIQVLDQVLTRARAYATEQKYNRKMYGQRNLRFR